MTNAARQLRTKALLSTRGLATALAIVCVGPLVAQPNARPSDQPTRVNDAAIQPLPSLDELLGLRQPTPGNPGLGTSDLLDRALSGESSKQGDPFGTAVDLMERSQSRLESQADAGVATQRLQAEALARLDQVIAQAKANQQQSQNSSSSSSSSQQPQPQQQPNQQQAQGQQQPGQRESNGEVFAPGLSGVNTGPNVDANGAAWGALPDRLRGALLQGVADQYSSLYERLTEKYYQQLAEEADG